MWLGARNPLQVETELTEAEVGVWAPGGKIFLWI